VTPNAGFMVTHSRQYSTLNVTETLVTIEEQERYTHALIDDVISNDLERP